MGRSPAKGLRDNATVAGPLYLASDPSADRLQTNIYPSSSPPRGPPFLAPTIYAAWYLTGHQDSPRSPLSADPHDEINTPLNNIHLIDCNEHFLPLPPPPTPTPFAHRTHNQRVLEDD